MSARATIIASVSLAAAWLIAIELRRTRKHQAVLNEMILMGVILDPWIEEASANRVAGDEAFRVILGDLMRPLGKTGGRPCV